MNLKKIFFCIALTSTSHFSYAQPVNQPKLPLEQALYIYSSNINNTGNAYLNIKGIKGMSKTSYLGELNLKILGISNIMLVGKDRILYISIDSPIAKTNFKYILKKNLPNYAIQELSHCSQKYDSQAKLYRLKSKYDGKIIYASAYANLSFEPYQSPLYTKFDFSLEKEDTWVCSK